jgi:hypothetical protein
VGVESEGSERPQLPQPERVAGGDTLDIRCPHCGKRCAWEEPFLLYLASRVPKQAVTSAMLRWDGWFVVEKFPSVLPWVPPECRPLGIAGGPEAMLMSGLKTRAEARGAGYYVRRQLGVVRCPHCYFVGTHHLHWPEDAYYQWVVRGRLLWAWSTEHARVLLAFLGSDERDAATYPAYAQSLRNLPKHVLPAKVRPRIVKLITQSLDDGDR